MINKVLKMALVAYDYDSTSENEDDGNLDKTSTINNSINAIKTNLENEIKVPAKEISDVTSQNNLFSNLPQTKTNINKIAEDQIEDFIPKSKVIAREKQKVKITIPSLSQFIDDEEDEPQIKKLKLSVKGSGLISMLPPVKGTVTTTKTFVPNVVANKNKNNSSMSKAVASTTTLVPNKLRKIMEAQKSALLQKMQQKQSKQCGSDIESDDDLDMPETFDDDMWQKVCGRPKPKQIKRQEHEETVPQESIDIAPEPEKPYEGLDNKAFKELIGKSKRPIGNIKLIDINEEEILPEKDLWMTKSLTDPEMAPKPQIEEPVDPTRRKKHHITYLAQQAKANEQELQNAWSASKNNRMATRAKYGF